MSKTRRSGADSRSLEENLARSRNLPRLLDRLVAAGEAPTPRPEWRGEVEGHLERLTEAFNAHVVADEDPEGFLAAAERQAPHHHHALERQREEHIDLRNELNATWAAIHGAIDDEGVAHARDMVDRLATVLGRHLHRGDCLAWEIANEDLGAGD